MTQLIFGAVSVIPAKDALPIDSLNMLIVLDPNGGLWVYSGSIKVSGITCIYVYSGASIIRTPLFPN